ncbi:MAG: hypothetical protein HOO96_28040 [Polyangiaceae bacterium]|nr:hypothetical protein [Polyangiaceae bacterium]
MRNTPAITRSVNVPSHRTVNAGAAVILACLLAACSGTQSEAARPHVAAESPPALREGCVGVGGKPCAPSAAGSSAAAPVRRIDLATGCRTAMHLAVSAAMLEDDAWPCACHESERTPNGVRAGGWCGLPQANEGPRGEVSITLERVVLAPGESAHVLVRLRNPSATAATYRLPDRHLSARFVDLQGKPLTDVFQSAPYRDEALVELAPGGILEVSLEVAGTYARWVGTGASATTEQRRLAPGRYAIQVFVKGLGGEESRLVPFEVRGGT